MNRYHRPRFLGDLALHVRNVDSVIVLLDVNKHRLPSRRNDGVGGGHKRKRWQQHLVALLDTGSKEGRVEGGCSRVDRKYMFDAEVAFHLRFKVAHAPAAVAGRAGQRVLFKDAHHFALFLFANPRLVNGNHA